MTAEWHPACSLEHMRFRAHLLRTIRDYFFEHAVLEVETPLLGSAIGTDPQLAFFSTEFLWPPKRHTLFLQTSPEFAMKRLLASNSGSIYQICKAFRNSEVGRYHNPEFTLLEWYRVGFDLPRVMEDCENLILRLFEGHRDLGGTVKISYQEAFRQYTGLNALEFSHADYCAYAKENHIPEAAKICGREHSTWLDFLFSSRVQPHLGENALCMVYGYPACHSSLARTNADDPRIADRVELFIDGIELGNGFYELTDPAEQSRRFAEELTIRKQRRLPIVPIDTRLIAALESGLPECSGMAIGLDRLQMVLCRLNSIDDVLGFPVHRA
ncbi:MAG: EF-P lysine aminoacylase EpmA [Gammaproteobacteria bacterium]